MKLFKFISFFILIVSAAKAQTNRSIQSVFSGVPWFDNNRNTVSAHGANILKDNGRYYLFGEKHSDTSNLFAGFNCYSSNDLYNWKFESIALPLQIEGKLGANRVGERPKVMKCPKTGEYLMFMHVDTLGYTDQFVGYALATNIIGPYHYQGPILFNGKPIRKWDMGTFQDQDGNGYILLHGGDIYKLNDDYRSVTEHISKAFEQGFESPAMFKKDSLYYFIGSNLTSWEKNDNYYFTSTALKGPWTKRGLIAPKGTLTWNSQVTYILPIEGVKGTTFMFMGDRWSYPRQYSAATYIWQPLVFHGDEISLPEYRESWKINISNGLSSEGEHWKTIISNSDKKIIYSGEWNSDTISTISSDKKDASFTFKFNGRQIGFYSVSNPKGGYAQVQIRNLKGEIILNSIVDLYCKYPVAALKFLSPTLTKGTYFLTVSVMGERGNWSDKRKSNYGSTGYFVSLEKLVVNE